MNFDQFMQAALSTDQVNPGFLQQPPPPPRSQQPGGMTLSPYAPVFNPTMPPPNMFPPGQGPPPVPVQNYYQSNPLPPPHAPNQKNERSRSQDDFVSPQPDVCVPPFFSEDQHQHLQQRGGYQNNRGSRSWGRGRGRSRGRGGQGQFQNNSRGGYYQQYPVGNNFRGRPPRQQQQIHSRASERHARDDYGDFFYSHVDMMNSVTEQKNVGGRNSMRSSGSPAVNRNGDDGDFGHRGNMYVRKVNQYYNRDSRNAPSQNSARSESGSMSNGAVGGGRGGYRADRSGPQYPDSGSKNGVRSAPPGKRRDAGINKDKADNSEAEEGDRRVQMEEQLKRGRYECMVCCDNIRQEVAVWNCQKCYHVFHLRCIKQWVKSSLQAEEDIWRCPACQNLNLSPPSGYRCFCGKVKDPKFQPGETPHSCGEICRRKGKEGCTHRCTQLCHPGPCPPCNAVVQRTCDCGAERKSMRCGQIATYKCTKVCGKSLNCGKHQCQVVCHEGDCLPCQETLVQECYAGHKKREVKCGSEEAIMLSFSCKQPCSKTLGCGNHVCEELCHPGECGTCHLLPEQVTHCCCGQTPLSALDAAPRTSCLDPVPCCDKVCSQPMACGPQDLPHFCPKKCHEGPCGQCEGVTTLTCVCEANQKEFSCRELDQFVETPFKCERRCNKKRMCGRHKCNELCCTRDVHICEVVCGRPLNCGLHKCEQLCHRGNCSRCLQASFEELTCHCGAEVMYPPVPCGTQPPSCHRICTRTHNCNHPVRHTCHSEENCPPCAQLVQKPCVGEHEIRKNVPCYLPEILCGRPCGKPLPCGQHKCIKTCHKGPCQSVDQNEQCTQPCRKKRDDCGHPCGAPCHPDSDTCPPTPCKAQIELKCVCGNNVSKVQCQGGSNMSAEIAQFQRLTVQAMASGAPGQDVDISQLTMLKKNTARHLECDSNCALLERNRRMALALEIQNPDLDAKLSGPKFSDFLKESAKKYSAFVSKTEKNLIELVQNAKQSKQTSRSFAFPAMNREQRRVVHELAEAYGCETQSYDYEPNKNVVATANRNRCWLPTVTLMNSVSQPKAPRPIPHHTKPVAAWGNDKLATSLFSKDKDKDRNKEKPAAEIDYFDFSSK